MSPFIEWLENLGKEDTKVRAILKRSLAFEAGIYPRAYPYVESFLKGDKVDEWRRIAHYLVAGLWAWHWREGRSGPELSLGKACAGYYKDNPSVSTERRFITLLDADKEQLAYRLRQMVALLKEQSIDFGNLLKDVLYWNSDQKTTQNTWAREFYRDFFKEEIATAKEEKGK